jgi:Mg/Co/Ni transporter MgtE
MASEQDTAELTDRIEGILRGPDIEKAAEAVASIHPADRADLYERLDPELREAFLSVLSSEARWMCCGREPRPRWRACSPP